MLNFIFDSSQHIRLSQRKNSASHNVRLELGFLLSDMWKLYRQVALPPMHVFANAKRHRPYANMVAFILLFLNRLVSNCAATKERSRGSGE